MARLVGKEAGVKPRMSTRVPCSGKNRILTAASPPGLTSSVPTTCSCRSHLIHQATWYSISGRLGLQISQGETKNRSLGFGVLSLRSRFQVIQGPFRGRRKGNRPNINLGHSIPGNSMKIWDSKGKFRKLLDHVVPTRPCEFPAAREPGPITLNHFPSNRDFSCHIYQSNTF